MLRTALGYATRCLGKQNIQPLLSSAPAALKQIPVFAKPINLVCRQFSGFSRPTLLHNIPSLWAASKQLMEIKPTVMVQQTRSVTKRSIKKGKRKTVKAVIKTFYRLHWGIWIHARAHRHKRLWKKPLALQLHNKRHVFCSATRSTMLDKMVTTYWKRPFYWVDNPYEPFNEREEFHRTRQKPLPAHTPPPENP